MKLSLKQKIFLAGLDFTLGVLVLIAKFFSFKGLLKFLIVFLLFVGLVRGCPLSVSTKTLPVFRRDTYLPLSIPVDTLELKDVHREFPDISAKAILVVDLTTDQVLHEKNADLALAPASVTKLMSALVAQDIYDHMDVLKVPLECVQLPGMKLGLFAEETLSYLDLLNATLIASSNDATCTLANGFISQEAFVEKMNEKAMRLGLTSTHLTNPVGFDDPDFNHFSTARDLYKLVESVKKDPVLSNIVRKKSYTLSSGQIMRTAYSTNQLLWTIPETVGIKTGTTTLAGQVLIYEYRDSSRDKDLLIVLMGSQDRFGEVNQILDWVSSRFVW